MEEMACVSIYTHIWLHVGFFLSYKLRCQFTFTFPCLITRWIWFLGRSVWLQWLQPDISQCQAFPRRALPMSPSLDLETPSAIPSPQWKLKNVLTLKSLLYTDMQYSGTFQNNHVHFANVLLGSRCWARAARAECRDNVFRHCVVIYTVTALRSNWALFISIKMDWLNVRPLILVLFDSRRRKRAANLHWLQGDSSNLGTWVVISCQSPTNAFAISGSNCKHLSVPLT